MKTPRTNTEIQLLDLLSFDVTTDTLTHPQPAKKNTAGETLSSSDLLSSTTQSAIKPEQWKLQNKQGQQKAPVHLDREWCLCGQSIPGHT